tara:strand:+ start:14280 stop:14993 length:714 start_codon:yes stop_codon:yes gene_type:complete
MANDKTLLSEATIRRFMKLAELSPLSEQFVDNMSSGPLAEEDELEDEMEVELDAEAPLGDEDLDVALDAEAEVETGPMSPEEMIQAMAEKLQDLAAEVGVEVDVESDEGEVEDVPAMDDVGADEFDAGEEELDLDVEDELDEKRQGYDGRDASLEEDKAYTAKEEEAGEDKRKGAEKRGAEGTKKKTSGKGRGEKKGDDAYVNEEANPLARADIDLIDDDALVQEVSRRVINRLLKK